VRLTDLLRAEKVLPGAMLLKIRLKEERRLTLTNIKQLMIE